MAFIRHLPNLAPDELAEMRKMNPKSHDEWLEEQEEEQFLRGAEPPQQRLEKPKHRH